MGNLRKWNFEKLENRALGNLIWRNYLYTHTQVENAISMGRFRPWNSSFLKEPGTRKLQLSQTTRTRTFQFSPAISR